eukprot:365453-Chlamydomonas_euryale.AAC.7
MTTPTSAFTLTLTPTSKLPNTLAGRQWQDAHCCGAAAARARPARPLRPGCRVHREHSSAVPAGVARGPQHVRNKERWRVCRRQRKERVGTRPRMIARKLSQLLRRVTCLPASREPGAERTPTNRRPRFDVCPLAHAPRSRHAKCAGAVLPLEMHIQPHAHEVWTCARAGGLARAHLCGLCSD